MRSVERVEQARRVLWGVRSVVEKRAAEWWERRRGEVRRRRRRLTESVNAVRRARHTLMEDGGWERVLTVWRRLIDWGAFLQVETETDRGGATVVGRSDELRGIEPR